MAKIRSVYINEGPDRTNPYGATVEPVSKKPKKIKDTSDSDSLASSDEDNVFVLPSMQRKSSLNVLSRKSSKKLTQFKFKMSSNNLSGL